MDTTNYCLESGIYANNGNSELVITLNQKLDKKKILRVNYDLKKKIFV